MPSLRLRRIISRRRPAVIAALAAVCVLASISALRSEPATRDVVVAVRDLPGYAPVTAADVALRPVPESALPATAIERLEDAVGSAPLSAVSSGEILTGARLSRLAIPPGTTAVPLRFPDDSVAAVLTSGDTVDIVGPAGVLARGGTVLRIVRPSALSSSAVVLVAVPHVTAVGVAQAAKDQGVWATLPGTRR